MNSKKKEGKVFYKYQTINEHLFESLKNNQLYFSDPRNFNDPLDSVIDGYYEGTNYEWLKSPNVDDIREIEVGIKISFLKRNGEKIRYDIPKIGEHFGISYIPLTCSFSERRDNILMWSHYANDHKGVCLCFKSKYKPSPPKQEPEYEYVLTINLEDAPLYKIKYQNVAPKKLNFLDKSYHKRVPEFMLTKSLDWEYEKEYRTVLPEEWTPNKNNFKKEELEGIIFGLNRTYKGAYKDVCEVYKVIKENYLSKGIHIDFYRTVRIVGKYKGTYKIRIVKIDNINRYLQLVKDAELNMHLQIWKPRNTTAFIDERCLDKYIKPIDRELFEYLQNWIPLNPRQM